MGVGEHLLVVYSLLSDRFMFAVARRDRFCQTKQLRSAPDRGNVDVDYHSTTFLLAMTLDTILLQASCIMPNSGNVFYISTNFPLSTTSGMP